jgi:hypothetical protein
MRTYLGAIERGEVNGMLLRVARPCRALNIKPSELLARARLLRRGLQDPRGPATLAWAIRQPVLKRSRVAVLIRPIGYQSALWLTYRLCAGMLRTSFLDGEPVQRGGELAWPARIGHAPAVEQDFTHGPMAAGAGLKG